MSDTDRQCIAMVNELAAELLTLSPDELLARPEYGVFDRDVNGRNVGVAFWHYAFGDEHRIGFQLSRRWFWFVRTSYVAGVVFGAEVKPRLMTPLEADDYW